MKESTGVSNKFPGSIVFETVITSLGWSSCYGLGFCCSTEKLENTMEQPPPAYKHNKTCTLKVAKGQATLTLTHLGISWKCNISFGCWAVAKLHSRFHDAHLWAPASSQEFAPFFFLRLHETKTHICMFLLQIHLWLTLRVKQTLGEMKWLNSSLVSDTISLNYFLFAHNLKICLSLLGLETTEIFCAVLEYSPWWLLQRQSKFGFNDVLFS